VNPEVDRRLDGFMQANSKLTEYYTNLVKEHGTSSTFPQSHVFS
jgi:hypothetical protein